MAKLGEPERVGNDSRPVRQTPYEFYLWVFRRGETPAYPVTESEKREWERAFRARRREQGLGPR